MFRKTFSFDDILLVPRYSDLQSRNECDVSMDDYNLPIVMSVMDTVTTKNMIKYFIDNNLMATVHRYFKTPEEQFEFVKSIGYDFPYSRNKGCGIFFAVGSVKKHKDWIDYLYNHGVCNFCVDMAHGDSKLCVETIKYLKSLKNKSTFGGKNTQTIFVDKVMAGNVVTKSGFDRLQEAGADYIRVGIGSGCFTPETIINTENGQKYIKNIKNGDKVYTHDGTLQQVINTLKYQTDEYLYQINNIQCTSNHEFYVVHENDINRINENNIHLYAKWIRADELSNDWYMVELLNEDK